MSNISMKRIFVSLTVLVVLMSSNLDGTAKVKKKLRGCWLLSYKLKDVNAGNDSLRRHWIVESTILTKTKSFKKDEVGYEFFKNGTFTYHYDVFGFCGNGPAKIEIFEGEWKILSDSMIHLDYYKNEYFDDYTFRFKMKGRDEIVIKEMYNLKEN